MVAGLRGLINVQGGIETHARMLYPLLARLGCDIEIVQRSPYYSRGNRPQTWHGLTLTYLWSPTRSGLETAVHTLIAVLYAAIKRPDILHLHAVGPGLLAPLAKLFGLRIVWTHHATDYDREKWGTLAKRILQTGERLGVRFANRPIAVSPAIQKDLEKRFGVYITMIPNGAPRTRRAITSGVIEQLGLTPTRYVLCVARLEPTKRQVDLIDAFECAQMPRWKLALVGAAAPGEAYFELLCQRAARNSNIVLTGYQRGRALRELYSHAGVFVLPSSLEGHPIALLEAASYGVPILASAIPANLVIPLPPDRFFPVGDTAQLTALLKAAARGTANQLDCKVVRDSVRSKYSWRNAARLTRSVYDAASVIDWPDHTPGRAHG
jgi:glycosyltransferase involved in cell wall biosynthesis